MRKEDVAEVPLRRGHAGWIVSVLRSPDRPVRDPQGEVEPAGASAVRAPEPVQVVRHRSKDPQRLLRKLVPAATCASLIGLMYGVARVPLSAGWSRAAGGFLADG